MFDQLMYNLKHNRKSTMKSATAWVIFGAIILVFVFWGMSPRNQGMNMGSGGAAATVNDATISILDFNEAMERMRRDPRFEQLQALGGDAGRQILQQQALSQLVEGELLRQATDKARIWTTDAEVRKVIMDIPAFQQDGRFSAALYHAYLDNTHKNASELEDEIRREQAVRRTVQLFNAALKPTKAETDKVKELEKMRADVEYVSVPTDALVQPESVSSADAKAYLADKANAAKVKEYFDGHTSDFSQPERVKVRHILIRAKAGDADEEKKALAKIQDIQKRAKTEDFAKLAGEFSEDPGSKTKGGLIDYFSRGKMVPPFEQAAFSQAPNVIGEPVKTDYGYHLIQVIDKKPASSRSFDDVKEEIATILVAKDRSRVALEDLEKALKADDKKAVDAFVAAHKLKWDDTGAFNIEAESVPKLGANDELIKAAFDVSAEKPLSPSLLREGTRALIVRYKTPPPAKDEPKSQGPEMMAEMTGQRRSEDALRKWLEDLRKTAKISTNAQLFGKGGMPAADAD